MIDGSQSALQIPNRDLRPVRPFAQIEAYPGTDKPIEWKLVDGSRRLPSAGWPVVPGGVHMSTVVGSGAQRLPGQCGTPRKRALPHPLACNHAAQDIRYRRDERSLVLRWKERQPRRTPGVIAVSNSGWNRLAAAFRDWNTQVYD